MNSIQPENIGVTMRAFQIAICDDEKAQTEYLRKLILEWLAIKPFHATIQGFPSAEAFLFAQNSFDILLLDIQMGGATGLELAQKLRQTDRRAQIIFVTAFDDFMAEGYDVDAVHYLMKPVDEAKLFRALDKALTRLGRAERSLMLTVDGETVRLPIGDVIAVESFAHYQEITTSSGVRRVKIPFYSFEKQLGDGFIRCHRSYIVGLRHVTKITKTEVILDNG